MSRIYGNGNAISEAIERALLQNEVRSSDRVICLGHGLPQGLLGAGCRLVIDDGFADDFRGQPENIYIWCNADCYVRRHELKGFATGMFISEPKEAYILNVPAKHEQIEESNNLFADIMARSLDLPCTDILKRVKKKYRSEGNPVIDYNRRNIFTSNNR